MEGSGGDDVGAPDSWESADLEESVRRLMISSKKPASDPPPPTNEITETPPASESSTSGRAISDEDLNQVDEFLREALEKPRERLSILRMEQDIVKFICDPTREQLEFEDLPTSYLRLAAHRVAQHYYLQSIAMPDSILPDGSGSRIVLRKTTYCKLPPVRLADIPVNRQQEEPRNVIKVAIKQRPRKNMQSVSSSTIQSSKSSNVKSVEERKEDYNRARARIFSGAHGNTTTNTEAEPKSPDSFLSGNFMPVRSDEQSFDEEPEFNLPRDLSDYSIGGNRLDRNRDAELDVSRYRPSNRVAIFRDREVDRKDPDYDRSYDRYMQRFDPGYVFNGGHYTMQPMYSPVTNYSTEFPQLGSSHRPQIPIDHQPQPVPQHFRRPWSATSAPHSAGYGLPGSMMPPFNPSFIGARPSSVYMHSSQYPTPPGLGMSFIHQHEHVQPFSHQVHQQHSESSFGLARPR